jgi:hypothetical protein
MTIKDPTTKEQRQARSIPKDQKVRKLFKELSYRDEGELFLISLKNSSIEKLKRSDYYKVETI